MLKTNKLYFNSKFANYIVGLFFCLFFFIHNTNAQDTIKWHNSGIPENVFNPTNGVELAFALDKMDILDIHFFKHTFIVNDPINTRLILFDLNTNLKIDEFHYNKKLFGTSFSRKENIYFSKNGNCIKDSDSSLFVNIISNNDEIRALRIIIANNKIIPVWSPFSKKSSFFTKEKAYSHAIYQYFSPNNNDIFIYDKDSIYNSAQESEKNKFTSQGKLQLFINNKSDEKKSDILISQNHKLYFEAPFTLFESATGFFGCTVYTKKFYLFSKDMKLQHTFSIDSLIKDTCNLKFSYSIFLDSYNHQFYFVKSTNGRIFNSIYNIEILENKINLNYVRTIKSS